VPQRFGHPAHVIDPQRPHPDQAVPRLHDAQVVLGLLAPVLNRRQQGGVDPAQPRQDLRIPPVGFGIARGNQPSPPRIGDHHRIPRRRQEPTDPRGLWPHLTDDPSAGPQRHRRLQPCPCGADLPPREHLPRRVEDTARRLPVAQVHTDRHCGFARDTVRHASLLWALSPWLIWGPQDTPFGGWPSHLICKARLKPCLTDV